MQVPISLSLNGTFEDVTITDPEEREKAFGRADHVRLYARDYRDRLEEAGFSVEEFRWTKNVEHFGGLANRYGLNEDEVVYRAIKPKGSTGLAV